jgi:hypothetical protein
MLDILRPPLEKANDFVYLYLESFSEKQKFLEYLEYNGNIDEVSTDLINKCLDKASQSASIFSIQLIHEYLCLDERFLRKIAKWIHRINIPGMVMKRNWSLLLPVSLDKLLELEINRVIKEITVKSNRV